jgi:hypothetical protein
MTVVRMQESSDPCKLLPFTGVAIANVIFSGSGLVNVCLYMITRPGLFPSLKRERSTADVEDPDVHMRVVPPPNRENLAHSRLRQPSPPPMLKDDDETDIIQRTT